MRRMVPSHLSQIAYLVMARARGRPRETRDAARRPSAQEMIYLSALADNHSHSRDVCDPGSVDDMRSRG